jgi:hypothetical protein
MTQVPARRLYLVGAVATVGLMVGSLVVRFGPAVTLSLGLTLPATEPALAPFGPAPTREEIVVADGRRPIRADLYRGARPRGALVLVHGLSRAGRRHPELARLARLLARHGELVLVPEVEGLVAFQLSGAEVDQIRCALRYAARLSDAVGIAGFSFGAGPALVAAAGFPGLRLVGSFGGYADLANVITYVTTGVHTFHGRRYAQRQEEYNRWKLLRLLVGFLPSERDRQLLGAIADRKARNPVADGGESDATLGRDARAVLNVVLNRRETAVPALLADLSRDTRDAMARLSSLAAVPSAPGRLLIAHGTADDSIPFTESLRLAEAAGARAQLELFESFHHTGPDPFGGWRRARVEDAWRLVRLADSLLAIDR